MLNWIRVGKHIFNMDRIDSINLDIGGRVIFFRNGEAVNTLFDDDADSFRKLWIKDKEEKEVKSD